MGPALKVSNAEKQFLIVLINTFTREMGLCPNKNRMKIMPSQKKKKMKKKNKKHENRKKKKKKKCLMY